MGLAGEGTLLRLLQHLMSASLSMQPRRSVRKLCASSRQVRGLRAGAHVVAFLLFLQQSRKSTRGTQAGGRIARLACF